MRKFPPLPPLFPDIHCEKITSYFKSLPIPEKQIIHSDLDVIKLQASYFLCFTNRCGSNYVAQAMSSDGQLTEAGENINFDTVIEHSQRLNVSSFFEYFSWLINATKGRAGIFGCKMSVGQLLFLYNVGILQKIVPAPKFIHIIRRDTVAQAVSLFIADKSKKWTSEQESQENFNIEYDGDKILAIVQSICFQNAMFESIFRILNIAPIVVYYEEFLDAPQKIITQIGHTLGMDKLTYCASNIRYKKQANKLNDFLIEKFRQEFKF